MKIGNLIEAMKDLKRKEKPISVPLTFVGFSTNKGRFQSDVIKENSKTVLVKTPDGNIVKRHKFKHNVMNVT